MRRWLAGMALVLLSACARLDYDAVGIHHSVVRGGQAQIDAGNVVDVDGLPGIWLAGHRTTHGSVFAHLVDAKVGDRVCVYSTCFTVFDLMVVPGSYVVTRELAPLVLQTSLPYDQRLLVLAR